MGIPWKKIGQVFLGIGKSGLLPVPGLPMAIELIEDALPDAKGSDKKKAVEAISDAILSAGAALQGLTEEQVEAVKRARSKAIDAYVAARNAESAAQDAFDELRVVIATFKK